MPSAIGSPHVLIFHESLLSRGVGSTEKFLLSLGHAMVGAGWEVWYSCATPAAQWPQHLRGAPFAHQGRERTRPFRFIGMRPRLKDIVDRLEPDLFISPVWHRQQFPFVDLPPDLPVIQLSPHGAYCPYGDVRHVWVQGARNLARVRAKGAPSASQLFNPLPLPPFNDVKGMGRSGPIVFGRTGRADPDCFDPIALDAYALLEREFQSVSFRYVAPCDRTRAHAQKLGLKRIEFIEWLEGADLDRFYRAIDVFCHARKDGETCGIAIAEAMLAQNPVITHRSAHHNDHIDGPFGVALRVSWTIEPEEYAAHMRAFVLDPFLTAQTGTLSRKIAAAVFGRGWGKLLGEIDAAVARRPLWSPRRAAYRLAGAAMSMAGA